MLTLRLFAVIALAVLTLAGVYLFPSSQEIPHDPYQSAIANAAECQGLIDELRSLESTEEVTIERIEAQRDAYLAEAERLRPEK